MIYPRPKDENEARLFRREAYEVEKEDLILFHKEKGYRKILLEHFL